MRTRDIIRFCRAFSPTPRFAPLRRVVFFDGRKHDTIRPGFHRTVSDFLVIYRSVYGPLLRFCFRFGNDSKASSSLYIYLFIDCKWNPIYFFNSFDQYCSL